MRAGSGGTSYTVREGVDTHAGHDAEIPVALADCVAISPESAQLRADILGRTALVCPEPT